MSDVKKVSPVEVETAVAEIQRELNSLAGTSPQRIDCSPETVEQGLAKLVLGLMELLRKLLERQAIRRMDGGTLSDEEIERMGLALMQLERKIAELAGNFGLTPRDLNLDLGPLGSLLGDEKDR